MSAAEYQVRPVSSAKRREPIGDRLEPGLGFGDGEARPGGEIANRRRAVTGEVPRHELGHARVTIGVCRRRLVSTVVEGSPVVERRPVVEQGVGVLLAATGTAADQRLQLGVHQKVCELRPVGVDAGGVQHVGDLAAGARAVAGQRRRDQVGSAGERRRLQAEAPVPVPVDRLHPRAGHLQQPPNVVSGHEVPGRTQQMGAQDVPAIVDLVDVGVGVAEGSLGQRPFRLGVLLRLNRAERAHRVLG